MTRVEPSIHDAAETNKQDPHQQPLSATQSTESLRGSQPWRLPAKEHLERYMRHKWRLNHKRSTLSGSFNSVKLFLDFYGKSGKREIEKVERNGPGSLHRTRSRTGDYESHGSDATGLPDSLSALFDGAGCDPRLCPQTRHSSEVAETLPEPSIPPISEN